MFDSIMSFGGLPVDVAASSGTEIKLRLCRDAIALD
jgi:hypothetical protein